MKKMIAQIAAICLLTNLAYANNGSPSLLQQRVQLLEQALQPTQASSLISMYAEAVKNRNGAVQYMLYCDDLQKKFLPDFQRMNWVTGVSSPSVMSYKIDTQAEGKYIVHFTMGLQGKMAGEIIEIVEVKKTDARLCINMITKPSS